MISCKDDGAVKDVFFESAKIGEVYMSCHDEYVFKSTSILIWSEQTLKELSDMLKKLNKH